MRIDQTQGTRNPANQGEQPDQVLVGLLLQGRLHERDGHASSRGERMDKRQLKGATMSTDDTGKSPSKAAYKRHWREADGFLSDMNREELLYLVRMLAAYIAFNQATGDFDGEMMWRMVEEGPEDDVERESLFDANSILMQGCMTVKSLGDVADEW